MLHPLLSIAKDHFSQSSSSWLFVIALSPALLLVQKKKRKGVKGFFQKILLKKLFRKAGKGMSRGTAILLGILAILALGVLSVWLLGWAWSIIIILLGLLYIGTKKSERDYE